LEGGKSKKEEGIRGNPQWFLIKGPEFPVYGNKPFPACVNCSVKKRLGEKRCKSEWISERHGQPWEGSRLAQQGPVVRSLWREKGLKEKGLETKKRNRE